MFLFSSGRRLKDVKCQIIVFVRDINVLVSIAMLDKCVLLMSVRSSNVSARKASVYLAIEETRWLC